MGASSTRGRECSIYASRVALNVVVTVFGSYRRRGPVPWACSAVSRSLQAGAVHSIRETDASAISSNRLIGRRRRLRSGAVPGGYELVEHAIERTDPDGQMPLSLFQMGQSFG